MSKAITIERLVKKMVETSDYTILDELDQFTQNYVNLIVNRERVLKRYEKFLLSEVHFHFVRVGDTNKGDFPDYCAVLKNSIIEDNLSEKPLCGYQVRGLYSQEATSKFEMPVLINVYEVVKTPQGMRVESRSNPIRLQSLDNCYGGSWDALKSVASGRHLLWEFIGVVADGELIYVRTVTRGVALSQLPNNMVESGSQIVKAITNYDTEERRRVGDISDKPNYLQIDIFLADDSTLVRMPSHLGFYACEVLFRPNDLIVDAV
jgi:hypothetical protein